jgi:hypothetical protein
MGDLEEARVRGGRKVQEGILDESSTRIVQCASSVLSLRTDGEEECRKHAQGRFGLSCGQSALTGSSSVISFPKQPYFTAMPEAAR